jgi:outer membrane protein assembly factor BamB
VIALELLAVAGFTWRELGRAPKETTWVYHPPPAPWARPDDVGRPISDSVAGLTMFRGNATRTYYGRGPVPRRPEILWRYPAGRPMCAVSAVGRTQRLWCGSGWTGQPSVIERPDGVELVFGAYDRQLHFLDAATGRRRRPSLPTGDIIKGSVTVDPDGYPLLYSGSRDNHFRVVALDRPRPTELWRLSAADAPQPMWNDDWDGNAVVKDDYLFEGGENGWFYVVRLNRRYDEQGLVQVTPQVLVRFPGFDQGLLDTIRDQDVSIENSPALFGQRVYFANSGGLVWGLDLGALRRDAAALRPDSAVLRPVFRYWGGGDVNATIVVDERGQLYVAAEEQRSGPRQAEVGHLYQLDPRRAQPRVWGLRTRRGPDGKAGIFSTPALFGRTLFVTTHAGQLLGVDRDSGIVRWERRLPPHAWSSPVVVDSTLIVADCEGAVHAFDVREQGREPPLLWEFRLPSGACIESTPAVWRGRIYVGARDGYFYAIGDR